MKIESERDGGLMAPRDNRLVVNYNRCDLERTRNKSYSFNPETAFAATVTL